MTPDPEVKVNSPEVKIVKPESGVLVALPFGLKASPKLWEPVEAPKPDRRVKTRRPGKNLARGRKRRGLMVATPSPPPVLPDGSPVIPESGSGGSRESTGGLEGATRGAKNHRTTLPEVVHDQEANDDSDALAAAFRNLIDDTDDSPPGYQITMD